MIDALLLGAGATVAFLLLLALLTIPLWLPFVLEAIRNPRQRKPRGKHSYLSDHYADTRPLRKEPWR